jgi:Tol biopolymer transport system component
MWILRAIPVTSEMRLEISTLPTANLASFAISPDGQRIVFVANSEGKSQLWLRQLDSTVARPLPKTDGASAPFWSPDSTSVGFFADGQLKTVDVNGGTTQVLTSAPFAGGGTWNREGTILFARTTTGPIWRISSTGGDAVAVTRVKTPQENIHSFPHFLPDGRHFLYNVSGSAEARGVYVGQLDGSSDTRRILNTAGPAVYHLSGHLLFVRQGALMAQRFDPVRLAVNGNPFQMAEGVLNGALSVSGAGQITYRAAPARVGSRQFIWVDRSGREGEKIGPPLNGTNPSISPDNRRLALQRTINGNQDIYLLDIVRGVLNRFTFDPSSNASAIWSPDGSRIVFGSNRSGVYDFYEKPVNGAGNEKLLLATPQTKVQSDWSPDGRFLLYRSLDSKMGYDLWALPFEGDRKPFPVVQTNSDERDGQFSPDGKWIAYQSSDTGQFEIYIQPFPGPGGKFQISSSGGAQVRWCRDGKELFYIALDGRLMAVPIQLTSDVQSVEAGTPVPLFITHIGGAIQGTDRQQYIVSPDCRQFLMNTVVEESAPPITLVLNWRPERGK